MPSIIYGCCVCVIDGKNGIDHPPTHKPTQTLFNQLRNGCSIALPLVFVVTAASVALAVKEHRLSASVHSPGSI